MVPRVLECGRTFSGRLRGRTEADFQRQEKASKNAETGNWTDTYIHEREEDGYKIRLYYWVVANAVKPDLIREAVFSYTVLADRADDEETLQIVNLLEQIISRASLQP